MHGGVRMQKKLKPNISGIFGITVTVLVFIGLLIYPDKASQGVKSGLQLLFSTVIPSLFPFAVLSSYISSGGFADAAVKLTGRRFSKIFKAPPEGCLAFLLGITGGYPIGAKTAAELYSQNIISKQDARRLVLWCVNAGPAFTVSAVGVSMMGNIKAGFILYAGTVISALTLGLCCRFLPQSDGAAQKPAAAKTARRRDGALIFSVTEGSRAILGISAWVLCFSCLSSLVQTLPLDTYSVRFIKSVLEVTTGCRCFAAEYPLPVTAAMLGFGGLCVICQVMPYLNKTGASFKEFAVSRIVSAALNAFYVSVLCKIFPLTVSVNTDLTQKIPVLPFSGGIPACIILIIMCVLLILEVDNNEKVC